MNEMTTEERLDKLERDLARLTCPETATEKVIRANKIILVDENGKERIRLAVDEDVPGLVLWDNNRKTRAALVVREAGPELELYDKEGMCRASLVVYEDTPELRLYDENHNVIWNTP